MVRFTGTDLFLPPVTGDVILPISPSLSTTNLAPKSAGLDQSVAVERRQTSSPRGTCRCDRRKMKAGEKNKTTGGWAGNTQVTMFVYSNK